MNKNKHFLFTEFAKENTSKTDKTLVIKDSKNINLCNSKISSWNNFSEAIKYLFNNEDSNIIITQNLVLLKSVIAFYPYEYFDENKKNTSFRLFALTSDYCLFEFENESKLFTLKHAFLNENFNVFYSQNSLCFLTRNGEFLYAKYGDEIVLKSSPKIDKFCIKNNMVIFNTFDEPFKVYLAEESSLENISLDLTQYEYFDINFDSGNIVSISQINNKIYIICNYKIYHIDTDEKVINLSQNLSYFINEKTVQNYEDYIVFLANNSLYSFDGNNIKNLTRKINFSLTNNANSFIFNEKYYIIPEVNTNFIFEINLNNYEVNKLYLENLTHVFKINSLSYHNLFLTTYDENSNYRIITIDNNGKITNNTQINFKKLSFDTISKKQICDVKIDAIGCYDFIIKSNVLTYKISCENSTHLNNINLLGNEFEISVNSNTKFLLENIGLNVLFLED